MRTNQPTVDELAMSRHSKYDLQIRGAYLYPPCNQTLCSYRIHEQGHTSLPIRYARAHFAHGRPCHLYSQGHPRCIKFRYDINRGCSYVTFAIGSCVSPCFILTFWSAEGSCVDSWGSEESFVTDGEGGRGISWGEHAGSVVRESEVGREQGKGMSLGSTPTFPSYSFVAKRIKLQLRPVRKWNDVLPKWQARCCFLLRVQQSCRRCATHFH